MQTGAPDRSERLKTLIVAALCLSGAAAASWALYLDRSAAGRAGQGPPLAMIERREASVRRKPAGSYLWSNANLLEDLYRRDAIQTNADSSALVRFTDNTILEIGENSLVVIDDVKDIQLGVMRGSLVLRSATGEDKKIIVDSQGKAKVEEIKLKLSSPEPLARLISTAGTREVQFSWKNPGKGGGPFRLEVSSDRAFSAGSTRSVESSETAAKLVLPPGRYFWRVSASGAMSEGRQFRIAQVAPLKPTYPSSQDRISRWGEDETLQFRWAAPIDSEPGAKHYLELADDPTFQQNRRESQVSAQAGAALLDGVKPGRHYWRLKSEFGDIAVQSRPEAIDVREAGDLAVTQTFPEDGARVELVRTGLRFGWDGEMPQVQGAKVPPIDFEIELQSADGKPVATNRGRERVYAWTQPKAGRYKWRVSALAGERRVGQTVWRSLSVQEGKPSVLLEPADKKDFRYWVEATPFVFKWTEDSMGIREKLEYRLEISGDRDFSTPKVLAQTRETSLASEKVKLEAGAWFWRVTLLDPQGGAIRSSEPRQLLAGQYPPLQPPSVAGTRAPRTYNPLEDERNPVLNWTPVAEAQSYEVTLLMPGRSPSAGGPTVLKMTVDGPKLELPGKELKPGEYEWQVRAIDRARRLGEPSTGVKLEVTYGAPLDAPETTTQEVQ